MPEPPANAFLRKLTVALPRAASLCLILCQSIKALKQPQLTLLIRDLAYVTLLKAGRGEASMSKAQWEGSQRKRKRRSPSGPGFTIPQFARAVGETEHVIRAAVRNGSVDAILFNGIKRIPPREKDKWREIWGEPSRIVE